MPEGIDLGISGLASGFDWRALVDQLTQVERSPQTRLRTEQNTIDLRKNAFASIATQLSVLRNRVTALKDASLYSARSTTVSDSTLATSSAAASTPQGSYAFAVTQLATTAARVGTSNVAASLSGSDDVSGLTLADASFASAVTAGNFTVNGKQVTIATSDTLQQVFDKVSTATGGQVTGAYNATTDKITLSSAAEIVLGSATDTSNFLTVARLSNNGLGSVSSTSALGALKLNSKLSAAPLSVGINDGGAGLGKLKINGVEITYNATTDSISDVIKRITDSGAGVTASYDSVNDRFRIANKTTGDLGIALEDVTGNFLAATGLDASTIQRGKDLLYTVNGGGQLASHSNTVTGDSSGIEGLSVTVLKENSSFTIGVNADTTKVKTAIEEFIEDYNKVQSLIDTNTASTTDAKGAVTAGTLASDSDASSISSRLRSILNAQVSGLTTALKQVESIGIGDSDTLDAALANNLGAIQNLFADSAKGIAVQLDEYLEKTIGDDGTIVERQDRLSKQSLEIDTQITDQEKIVQANRQRLISSFLAMESAQQRSNQQLQYLSQRFGTASS
jgi:flagellar hook-associated protein 2